MAVNSDRYAERLFKSQSRWWKTLLDVQGPYRRFLLSLEPGLTLDIGCGVGRNLKTLGHNGIGVDTDENAVHIARQQGLRAFSVPDFLNGHWAHEELFDSLLFAHVLEHMTKAQAVDTVSRWLPFLRPNGQLVLITPQKRGFESDPTHVEMMDFSSLASIVHAIGLVVVKTRSFPFPRLVGNVFRYNEFIVVARNRRKNPS